MRFEDQQLVLRPSPYGDDIMRRLGLGLMRPFVSVSIDEGPEAGDNWRLSIGVVGRHRDAILGQFSNNDHHSR